MFAFRLLCAAAFVTTVYASDYGRLTIRFENGEFFNDVNGHQCDTKDGGTACDSYIKVLIDGKEDFRTQTKWNENYPQFDVTYTSKIINKHTKLEIEVWDNEEWGDHEAIARWVYESISSIHGVLRLDGGNRNTLFISANWIPDWLNV